MSAARSALFLLFTACPAETTTEPVADWQLQSHVDDGSPCFRAGAAGVDVVVVLPDCLSSSCSRNLVGTCEATVDGATITLTSDIQWEENVARGAECTADCGTPTASCTIEGLADGVYQVEYGGETLDLTVPVDPSATCDTL